MGIGKGTPSLSVLIDNTYSGQGYNYNISDNIVSVTQAGAVEVNMIACPFSPAISIASGDSVNVQFYLESDSNSWQERRCNIFLSTADDTRINLCDETINDLDGFTTSATATLSQDFNSINIRFRSQGVSYNPALKFTIQIFVNGERML